MIVLVRPLRLEIFHIANLKVSHVSKMPSILILITEESATKERQNGPVQVVERQEARQRVSVVLASAHPYGTKDGTDPSLARYRFIDSR